MVYHVTVRGIEKRVIFHDDADRRDFLRRLARILSESEATCFGFALMPTTPDPDSPRHQGAMA